ncbi:hypothetical protein [uncultured Pedobacter sp.]|uniref:hypothetical protein n=1 Tax=uncultured Pedobacter sp. TaxID=246139 RepID=UPI0025E3CEB4|nr:hypothetical protein [uncultured Pedobacter sp.]
MNKNYSLLKQYLLAFAFLIFITSILHSCKKERKFSPLEVRKELILEAKTYFEEEVLSNNFKLPNDPNVRHSIMKRAEWEKAIIKKISIGDAVIVPIYFDEDVFSGPVNSHQKSSLNKNSYLMIYKDHIEKMHVEWVTLLPNKIRGAQNTKFSGIVVVESWNGMFNKAFAFNDTGKHIPVYISEAITFDKSSYNRSVTCFEVEHWGAVTVGGITTPKYLGSETFCSNNGSGNGNEDQGHPNNPVTEEEATPDDYITYFIDCNGDIDGAATIDPNCGCIGGNTGVLNCGQKEIIDSLKGYPCAQALLRKMRTNISSDIALLIKNTFAKDDNVNIKFKADPSLVGTDTDGQESKGNFSNLTGEFIVGLNPDILNKSTQEYILVTMYHEGLHAFFDRRLQVLGETEFKKRYEGVNVNGGRLLGVMDDGHIPMGYQNYLKGLKDVIMKFNPNFDENRAWGLAKYGIIQMSKEDNDLNKQERDTTKPGFTGTKCP